MNIFGKRLFLVLVVIVMGIFWWSDIARFFTGVSAEDKQEAEQYRKQVRSYAACAADSDCAAVYGKCGIWEAVNKQFEKDAKNYMDWKNSSVNCRFFYNPVPCNLACENGYCKVREEQENCPKIYHNEE